MRLSVLLLWPVEYSGFSLITTAQRGDCTGPAEKPMRVFTKGAGNYCYYAASSIRSVEGNRSAVTSVRKPVSGSRSKSALKTSD